MTVVPEGGVEPYSYSLDGNSQDQETFVGLGAGEHLLVVSDAVNCQVTQTLVVTSGVSYSESVALIVVNKCAITGCHISGTALPNFEVFGNFQSRALGVKTRTQSGDMPRTGSLSQEEKDLIACWVDDGALDN